MIQDVYCVAINMPIDHKHGDDEEHAESWGKVTPEGRVNGGLNVSKAMGKGIHILQTSTVATVASG